MALQVFGDGDMDGLIEKLETWTRGGRFQQRAAAVGLCEPRLLKQRVHARKVLQLLDRINASMSAATDRQTEAFKVLRQALGYCWSVAAVAAPEMGKTLTEKWLKRPDIDIRWIMRENLSKNRFVKMDAAWVECARRSLE